MQGLAKELLEMFTAAKMAKVFFVNSGSEANDTQVCQWYILTFVSVQYAGAVFQNVSFT